MPEVQSCMQIGVESAIDAEARADDSAGSGLVCARWCKPEYKPEQCNWSKCRGCTPCFLLDGCGSPLQGTPLSSLKTLDVDVGDGHRIIVDASASLGSVTVHKGGELVFADVDNLQVSVKDIAVHGTLQMGTWSCPLVKGGTTLTLRGGSDEQVFKADHAYAAPSGAKGKGLMVYPGGSLEVHGKRYSPTWTRLARTAQAGERRVSLQVPVNWEVGQQVMLTTTAYRDWEDSHQNEVRTLVSVDGVVITLDRPLSFNHYGGSEYSGEVALLSRSVVVQGDEHSEKFKFGGHTLCMRGSSCRLGYVEGYRLGQRNVMGRYPFHFHKMGTVDSSRAYFKGCSVHHSFFRAYTVHGTSGSEVLDNVAYDVVGSAYYLEDGVEENNTLQGNLAAFVHVMAPRSYAGYGWGQYANPETTTPERIVPTDLTAAGFYCTNANNRWRGNAASGGFVGFLFPAVTHALGASYAAKTDSYRPETLRLLEFDGNTAHSSGSYWSQGACIYVGGRLEMVDPEKNSSHYFYNFGRTEPKELGGSLRRLGMVFKNTKVFACRRGVMFWGAQGGSDEPYLALRGYEAHDTPVAAVQMLGRTAVFNAVLSCSSGNTATISSLPEDERLPSHSSYIRCLGVPMYDTGAQMLLTNVTFKNYDLQSAKKRDTCFKDLCHSNEFVPENLAALRNIIFGKTTPPANRFWHDTVRNVACPTKQQGACPKDCSGCKGTTVSSRMANMLDLDGSATGFEGGGIIGSDDDASETDSKCNEWWKLDGRCRTLDLGGFWGCPRAPTRGTQPREIVSMRIFGGATMNKARWSGTASVPGTMYHFGENSRRMQVGMAGNFQVTGACCDIGWYFLPDNLPSHVSFSLMQMVPVGGLIVAMTLPAGATPVVKKCVMFTRCVSLKQAVSKAAFLADTSTAEPLYFLEAYTVFVRLVNEHNTYFEYSSGARILFNKLQRGVRYMISHSGGTGRPALALPTGDWLDG
eukprot:TRINITY_DN5882_c0_g1_i2.p1 TRINITY_DN5882_c0_g1~~TRINITY_DN5882_c0_g1_i2.p1  ORF type:complete len:1020 (-),score=137.03 TRINITY_DN5882_c0_g1_i2:213-3131(-)